MKVRIVIQESQKYRNKIQALQVPLCQPPERVPLSEKLKPTRVGMFFTT